jgi:hypothetical protein
MLGDVARAVPLAGELGRVGDVGVSVRQQQPAGRHDPREVDRSRRPARNPHPPCLVDERGDGRVVLAPDDVEHMGCAVALDQRDADRRQAQPGRLGDDHRRVDQELLDRASARPEGHCKVRAAGLAVAAAATRAARQERHRGLVQLLPPVVGDAGDEVRRAR